MMKSTDGLRKFDTYYMYGLVKNFMDTASDKDVRVCVDDHIEIVHKYYQQRENGLKVKEFDILAMKHYVGLLDISHEE